MGRHNSERKRKIEESKDRAAIKNSEGLQMPSSPLRSERSDQENRTKKEILAHVVINYGHDSARIVREADPDGKPTEHLIVGTSRQIDMLLDKGIVNNDQHLAGSTLRDLFEQSAFLSTLAARDPSAPLGMFSEPTPNEAALARY
ncbi:MAG: hypothetical protein KGJ13_10900, partial [Patescibacteria group bacterium]|nr:hypothetical protein [Patescibacteria group bacterium]